MKTVNGSLFMLCLMYLLVLAPYSAHAASMPYHGGHASLDTALLPDDGEEALTDDGGPGLDLEQYAYDEGGDDDTYADDTEEDSDMEPAPEPVDPGPAIEDGGGDAAPTPDADDEGDDTAPEPGDEE